MKYSLRKLLIGFVLIATCTPFQVMAQTLEPVGQLAVFDSMENRVGTVLGRESGGSNIQGIKPALIAFNFDGFLFALTVNTDRFFGNFQTIYYESSDCTGAPLITKGQFPGEVDMGFWPEVAVLGPEPNPGTTPGNVVYRPNLGEIPRTVLYGSDSSGINGICSSFSSLPSRSVVSLVPVVDLDTLYTAPFELRPESGQKVKGGPRADR